MADVSLSDNICYELVEKSHVISGDTAPTENRPMTEVQ